MTSFQWGRRRHIINFLNSVLYKMSFISFSELIGFKSPQVDRNPMVFYQKLDNSESESEIGLPVSFRARVSRFTLVSLNCLFCKLRAHWLATVKAISRSEPVSTILLSFNIVYLKTRFMHKSGFGKYGSAAYQARLIFLRVRQSWTATPQNRNGLRKQAYLWSVPVISLLRAFSWSELSAK